MTEEAIDEGSFTLQFEDGTSIFQTGFFNLLYPCQEINRTYTFNVLKSQTIKYIEYRINPFIAPSPESLKWK